MECTVAGRLLYAARKESHVTQKELCYGYCNQSTLARIESGATMPSLSQMEFFFTRLGRSVPDNIVPITKAEKKRLDLEIKLSLISDSRDNNRFYLIQEYKNCHPSWGKLEEQFYLLQYGIYISQFDERLQESLEIFEKAFRITMPDFSVNQEIPSHLFSIHEIIIMNSIAHSEYYLYDLQKKDENLKLRAIQRAAFLKKYFEEHFKDYKLWNMYSAILFNLANWIGLDGDEEQSLQYSETALEIEKTSLYYFAQHLYNCGYSLAALEQKSKAARILKHSLTLYKLIDKYNDIEKLKNEIKTKFDIDLQID